MHHDRPSRGRSAALALALAVLGASVAGAAAPPAAKTAGKAPTVEEARAFLEKANARLLELGNLQQRASWVQANFITDDTEALSADALEHLVAETMVLAKGATRFDTLALPEDLARQLKLLKLAAIPLPAPSDPKLQAELAQIATGLEGAYGRGKYCKGPDGKDCRTLNDLSRLMAENRDYDANLDAWVGWHSIAPPMKPQYQRFVELSNQGARDLGYADLGAYWRSNYDMAPDAFAAELDRIWTQVRPLYESLHAYVRAQLVKKYGADKVPPRGPIPAHLVGNMWAQDFTNIYDLVAPPGPPSVDVTALLRAKKTDPLGMVRYGEGFFTSLGFAPLPKTFWERSLFVKPQDREVVCHASAWDVDNANDLRIKMCIEITGEDFVTIHHELGHNFYQRAYNTLPFLYRDSANDGFHEAIGDTIARSVTPAYLKKVGLLEGEPPQGAELGELMRVALDRVAFLPFGLVIDKWRWQVFSGEAKPDRYNAAWWDLREKYQGIAAPVKRTEADFDPGAKYHVPSNTPYMRYFLADILQFQFHRALCREAGFKGPLHECSIYGNAAAGKKLKAALEMGHSKPWPDALYAMTGERQMDATAMIDYFAPLKKWLDEQNKAQGNPIGW